MAAITENRNVYNCLLLLYCKSNLNCSCLAMNSSAYHPSFFVKFFVQPIYTKYAYNNENKNHIKIFCWETSAKMIFGWSTFKIMCDTPTVHHSSWLALLLVEISLNDKKRRRRIGWNLSIKFRKSNWKPHEQLQALGSL